MTETKFDPPAGASVWERDMLAYLSDHMIREGALLEEYADAAARTKSKALGYVMKILFEDEQRHHRWFAELASSLQTEASLSGDEPVIPWLDIDRFDHAAVGALVERMLASERADARELKRLRKELRDFEDTTLWGLLVGLMQRDTDKHIEILRFVERHSARHRGGG